MTLLIDDNDGSLRLLPRVSRRSLSMQCFQFVIPLIIPIQLSYGSILAITRYGIKEENCGSGPDENFSLW
jgi:hypothetical protein